MYKKGFSLLELIIVLSLLMLMLNLGISINYNISQWFIRAEIDKLYTICNALSYRAQLERQEQVLKFLPEANSYSFNNKTDKIEKIEKLSEQVVFGVVTKAKGPPSQPNKNLVSCCTFKNNMIYFGPDEILNSGSIYITDRQQKCLYALTIPVSSVHYIRIYSYNFDINRWKKIL